MTEEKDFGMTEEKDFGMTSEEIQRALAIGLDRAVSSEAGLALNQFARLQMLALHARALACHCECLGMNAENCHAACADSTPPYRDTDYFTVMQRWGLTNKKGESTI